MGKKASGKHYTSKGERPNVNKKDSNRVKRGYRENLVGRLNRQMDAFLKGKNVVLTVDNPNPNETNKRKIRVNAKDYWKTTGPLMKLSKRTTSDE